MVYLDLEGCFGDICDLSQCSYLAQREKVSVARADETLETILAERWAYDDISDDEEFDEENSAESQNTYEEAPSPAIVGQSYETLAVVEVERSTAESDDTSMTEDDSDDSDEDGDASIIKSSMQSQESTTLLWSDGDKANIELISHYIEVAQRGESIVLKSVNSPNDEVLL